MDLLKSLIHQLATAANNGEDNSVLLAMVEEIRNELIISENMELVAEESSVSVMLPNGFRSQVKQSAHSSVPTPNASLSAPRPPSVVVQALPVESPATLPEIVTEPVSVVATEPKFEHFVEIEKAIEATEQIEAPVGATEKVEMDFRAKIESLFESPEFVMTETSPAEIYASEDTLELSLTPEMIAEAVALEMQAASPEPEPEQVAEWQPPVAQEKLTPKLQEASLELNERMAIRSKVLNEVFEKNEPELVTILAEPKVADIKKAISINEKYQYINSLFRGDEDFFERSIKTLNNFHQMQEAHYWMQRELLVKMGWNEEDELVQRFYSLVKRRFS